VRSSLLIEFVSCVRYLPLGDDLFGIIECQRSIVIVDARLSCSWHSSFVIVLVLLWHYWSTLLRLAVCDF